MIDASDRAPGAGGMACVTAVAGIDMFGALSGGGGAIMASHTSPRHLAVIKVGVHPGAGGMTGSATAVGDDVCAGFSRSDNPVMTVGATTPDLVMVYPNSGGPGRSGMADSA